jgi:hypothetical protein
MSITSYSELKTRVADWLARETLTAYIPDFIMLGEMRIYRQLRLRAMEVSFSSTISSGVIAVPSGYVELKYAYIDGSPVKQLQRKDPGWIIDNYPLRSADAKPGFMARDADSFIFGAYPDSDYTVKGTYYKRLDALSDSNTTNWFITNAPDLLLFAALCEAEPFLKNDERVQLWEAKYKAVKDMIEMQEKMEQHSGSYLAGHASLR